MNSATTSRCWSSKWSSGIGSSVRERSRPSICRLICHGRAQRVRFPTERPLAGGDAPERAAIVIRCHDSGQTLDATLESISNQTRPPAVVVVVDDGSRVLATDRALARAEKRGLIVVRKPYRGAAEAKNTGISDVFRGDRAVSAISFLEAGDRLRPKYVATCLCVLRNRSEVGVVSVWAIGAGVCQPLFARPSPAFRTSGLRMMP